MSEGSADLAILATEHRSHPRFQTESPPNRRRSNVERHFAVPDKLVTDKHS